MSKTSFKGRLLVKMTQNGKLSPALFWITTKNASTFHFSWAIKWPTFHMNIPRLLSNFLFGFLSCFCCPHQEARGASGCTVLSSGVEKISAIRMSEHVLQHGAWREKQTPQHMKLTSACGQPWLWSIDFPIFNFHSLQITVLLFWGC